MKRKSKNRRGIVAVLVALSLVAILGVTAIALDGGMLLQERRDVQATADAGDVVYLLKLSKAIAFHGWFSPSLFTAI